MSFRSMTLSTIISIAAITVGGVLTVIGIVREIRPLAIGGLYTGLAFPETGRKRERRSRAMSLFRGSGRLEQKLAQNNDPMKQKKLWVKSFYCAAVLAALGLFFLLAMGSQFTVFACVLLGCAAFVFVDGLVTKNRK